jgi:hypothetical protein
VPDRILDVLTFSLRTNTGIARANLRDWRERGSEELSAKSVAGYTVGVGTQTGDTFALALEPPPIEGLGMTGGFDGFVQSIGTGAIGGMLAATFVAAFFVPVFFRWVTGWGRRTAVPMAGGDAWPREAGRPTSRVGPIRGLPGDCCGICGRPQGGAAGSLAAKRDQAAPRTRAWTTRSRAGR